MEHVVLVHGLGRRAGSMGRLKRGLENQGYTVQIWSYPSRQHRLKDHVKAFREWLAERAYDDPVHFVGHSLGGLIIRGALATDPPVSVGRIVMIASPNQGAGVVSKYGDQPFSRMIFGRPLEDLAEDSEAIKDLGVPDAEIGNIAGIQSFHPFNPVSWLNLFHYAGHEHDGTVELANTYLEEAVDHIAIDAHHTFICDHPDVIEQTWYFLKSGNFLH
jgi:triacylglycerol lipase